MALTTLQAEVTKTAAFNGTGVDISALAAPFQINLVVDALTSGSTAIFQLQTSVDNFVSDIRVEKTLTVKGPASSICPTGLAVHRRELPEFRNGTGSAKARLALTYLTGSSSVSYSSTISN